MDYNTMIEEFKKKGRGISSYVTNIEEVPNEEVEQFPELIDPNTGEKRRFAKGLTQDQLDALADLEVGSKVRETGKKAEELGSKRSKNETQPGTQSSKSIMKYNCKEYLEFACNTDVASIATKHEVLQIWVKWQGLGVPEKDYEKVSWEIARACADSGSSPHTELKGNSMFCSRVCKSDLIASIREICTLRQFCCYYAKVVWNIMLHTQNPPSNYIRKGYKFDERYAAFDFFQAVLSHAALNPENGLKRRPTMKEIIANQTNAQVSISRTMEFRNSDSSTAVEITGGSFGPTAKLKVRARKF